MSHTTLEALQREWELLHADHERYERGSLAIKIVAVVLSFAAFAFGFDAVLAIVFTLVLWLQDGIWKTFQARLGARLLAIEAQTRTANRDAGAHYQLYSAWRENRDGLIGLLREYVLNALRPTVAYPYAVLVLIALLLGVSQ